MKQLNRGRTIEGLPAAAVLEDDAIPGAVAEALASWREALEGLREPARVLREAEKVAQESTLLVRGERERWSAEIREKTAEEAAALRAAESRSSAAANALIAAIQEHGPKVGAVAARLALQAHAEAVDSALDVEEARARFGAVAPRGLPALPHVDTRAEAIQRGTTLRTSVLEDLDKVNVPAMVEIAGEDPVGFLAVVGRRGERISTTKRRAERLVGTGSNGWTYVEEDEEASA